MAYAGEQPAPRLETALFELGFRPFFLLGGLAALLLMSTWLWVYGFAGPWRNYYDPIGWHSHEMLFGFAVAVIAGFLLTAVRNWTGLQTAQGPGLAALATLWLLGRVLPFCSDVVPRALIAGVDLTFLPVLAVVIGTPLVRSGQKRNLIFLAVLAALTTANLLVHLQALGLGRATGRQGISLALHVILLLIVIIGGRVFPFFTSRALGIQVQTWPWVERLGVLSVVVLAGVDLVLPGTWLEALVATAAAALHGVRLWGWRSRRVWSAPLLWVLHLGYAWLVAGFALKALAVWGWVSPFLAVHAFTVGGIGGLILGMMARVALGHTGRALQPTRAITGAFLLIHLAALSRVLVPWIAAPWYRPLLILSGGLWIAAFLLFVAVYAPILVRPRPDQPPS